MLGVLSVRRPAMVIPCSRRLFARKTLGIEYAPRALVYREHGRQITARGPTTDSELARSSRIPWQLAAVLVVGAVAMVVCPV
jgi:hypothetical protein